MTETEAERTTPMITAQERRALIRTAHANGQFWKMLEYVLSAEDDDYQKAVIETVKLILGSAIELNLLTHELMGRGVPAADIEAVVGDDFETYDVDTDELNSAADAVAVQLDDARA